MYSGSPIDTIYVSADGNRPSIVSQMSRARPKTFLRGLYRCEANTHPNRSVSSARDRSRNFPLVQFHLNGFLTSGLDSVLSLVHDGLGRVGGFVFELLGGLKGRALLAALPQEDTGDLDNTNASKEEVDGGEAGRLSS